MKKGIVLAVVLSLIAVVVSSAQVRDDVYFDPDRDRVQMQRQAPVRGRDTYADRTYQDDYRTNGFDDEFDYYNDYDYYYTSRIRRFHRPYYGFGFFDPVYVDMWHYDPFISPGMTMLIYDDFYSFRSWSRWNRWNRWNAWSPAWGPSWGWGGFGPRVSVAVSFGMNPWSPFGWNSFGWNNFGWGPAMGFNTWNRWNNWNNWGFGGPYWAAGGGFVCPPTWGNGFAYNTVVNINNDFNNTVYGPRGGGSTTGPAPGARPGRTGFVDNSPGAAAPRTINTAGDRLPSSDRARIPAAGTGTETRGDLNNPAERSTPQPTRDSDRFFDRYPSRNTENTGGREVPSTRIPSNDRVPANTNERAMPADPNRNVPSTRVPSSTYDPNRSNTYDRPRAIDSGSRTSPSATTPSRAIPNTSTERPRVYTPPSRTYDRSSDSSFDRPRSTTSPSNSNSSFSSPRSSGSNSNSSFSSPRTSTPSGSSINNSSSRAGSSSGSSGSSSSSSSSGGRTRGN